MKRALITGSASGLGAAIIAALQRERITCLRFDPGEMEEWDRGDVTNPDDRDRLLTKVDFIINCAGMPALEFLSEMSQDYFRQVMEVNAIAPAMLVKEAIVNHGFSGTVVNIISNAAHIPMTASLAYNASKAALEIATKQMARELRSKHGIIVFGISPNRLKDTSMSIQVDRAVMEKRGWRKDYLMQKQLEALPLGEETPPEAVAEFLAFLLSLPKRHRYLHGTVIPYGGPSR